MAETLVASGESSAFGRTERWDTCTTNPPIFLKVPSIEKILLATKSICLLQLVDVLRRDPVYAASLSVESDTRAVLSPGSPQYGGGQVSYSNLKLNFCQAEEGCN